MPNRAQQRPEPETLQVIDDSENLTRDDVKNLKQIARYWEAGRLILIVIMALGAFGVGAVQVVDTVVKYIHR